MMNVVGGGARSKVATSVVSALTPIRQGAVPEQAPPLHPVKTEPGSGVAVNCASAPSANVRRHVAPQVRRDGLLVTVPDPVPARVTVTSQHVAFSRTLAS